MTESDSGQRNDQPRGVIRGWRHLPQPQSGTALLVLEPSHPDYPSSIREQIKARNESLFGSDPAVLAAVKKLEEQFAGANQDLANLAIELAVTRDFASAEERIDQFTRSFVQAISDAHRSLPPTKYGRQRFAYLMSRAHDYLPLSIRPALEDQLAPYLAPFLIAVNTGEAPTWVQLFPHETTIHLDRFATGDLPKLGRVITEAQTLADQAARTGKAGRPKLPDISHDAATPEMVAKLRHWEGWSYRRIAAFVGWLGEDEDWRNEKVRRRVEQRVRRWVREGEDDLRAQCPDRDWKTRPAHLERAIDEERPRL
jgi:hypothetical protein